MPLSAKAYAGSNKNGSEYTSINSLVATWRDHYLLNNWLAEFTGIDAEFDTPIRVEITSELLTQLENALTASPDLWDNFIDEDADFIDTAREALQNNQRVFYTSSF